MKRAWWIGGTVAAILALVLGVMFQNPPAPGTYSAGGPELYSGACFANEQIPESEHDAIVAAAQSFLERATTSPASARSAMAARAQEGTTVEALTSFVQRRGSIPAASPPAPSEVYLLKMNRGSESGTPVPCSGQGEGMVFIGRGWSPVSAVVVLTEDIAGASRRAITFSIEDEAGEWRVRAIHLGLDRIAGRGAEELHALARRQESRGNQLNAKVIYGATMSAMDRGSVYQHRLMPQVRRDMDAVAPPPALKGPPPFMWTFGGDQFEVSYMQYTGLADGSVALIIEHKVVPDASNEAIDAANRRLIDGVNSRYPEWREIFGALVGNGIRKGTPNGWATSFSKKTGYRETAPVEPQDQ